MASNATFEVEIYGNTTKFENSLKGVNTAMSGLRGEAKNLREALKLDPTNTGKMAQLQKNLQTQLGLSRDKATKLKEELATVDKSTPAGQKKWLQLTRDLGTAETQANRLESEIKQVEGAIKSGSWNIDAKMDTKGVNSGIDGMKSRFSGLREIAVGVFRQIGASAVSAVGNGLKGWVSDAMDTQKAMISLNNTMKFKGNGQEFDYVSKSMQNLAKDTNANTEDTLKLSTTFIGLGDTAKSAVSKTEALVKANQAFGGTGEQLKGVVQAYGQMSASGKVTAENINQLTDNNTALGSALKSTVMEMNPALKQYGSFAEASENGAVSVEMLDKAMQQLGKAGGGGVTTISDAWDSFNETLSLALLPTLDALTPIISALIDKMAGWGESAGKTITNVIKYFQDLFQKLQENGTTLAFLEAWDNIKSAFDSIVSIIGNVINSFLGINTETTKNKTSIDNVAKSIAIFAAKFSEVTKKISDFLKKISESKRAMDTLKGTLVVLASAFVALKVIDGIVKAIELYNKIVKIGTAIQEAFNAVMAINPFVALGIAIVAIVAGLVYFFTQTETGKKVWQSFVDFLSQSIEAIKQFFTGLGTWFSELWTSTVEGTKTIWNGITEFFSGLWNGIVTIITNVFATIASAVTGAYNWFVTTFQPLISFYQSIFNLIGSIINVAFQLILAIVRGAYQLVIGAWKGLSGFFGGIFNAVSSVVSSVFGAIGSFASSAWGVVRSIWSAVSGFFSGIFNSVRGVVSGVFSAIGGFASNAWSRISGVFSGVSGFFSGVFSGATSAVSGAFSAFGSFASNAYNAITGVFNGIGGFFSGIFGGIKNTIDSVLGGVTNTINNISGAINGIAGKLGGLFKGSMVVGLTDVNLSSSGYGLSTNSVSSDNRTYNTFNVQGGAGQDVSNLARAIRREFDLGRA
ncbi:tape measure protein [Lactococcus phage LP1011]|uniref:Tape measure protein n=5 Tax=Skunavirus TaxID=1623305 RepID=A0A2K8III1_9CAUD|nr:tail length tape measure protein [Lactococcus phage LP0209]YP_009879213.1 tail length tape measure protein [Lactococcus phage LP0903]ATE83987.1 tape measure protein [Lactococcus phage LP0212]ATE84039.1 tape measure protein [Lactococcus phage LP0304]ATE84093.1 tape measure protein [Lactococcus phage LP0509]ATE84147.1 tape measure protein [Lactococcus phage LP0604]ATE84256.1 tape measure protein [Lactococcus phage LP1005]ATE84312.1 tape measure protein [Lactococcus phage LP1011]